jgi:CHC2 zinc finger
MSDLFRRAKDAMTIEDLAGRVTTLHGSGDDRRGACPLCGAGAKSKTSFRVRVSKQLFECFACGERGDVVDLFAALENCTSVEAAKRLAGPEIGPVKARPARLPVAVEPDRRAERIAELAADMLAKSQPFAGSLAEAYLRSRGISVAVLKCIDGLRFHPAAPHHWDTAARGWITAPAMIAAVQTPAGATGGVHATYLAADGLAKAALEPAKLMWGPQTMATPFGPRVGGAALYGRDDDRHAVVGEGIETTLSLVQWLFGRGIGIDGFKVFAALSLNRLQGAVERDADRCIDLKREPGSQAFTWPPHGDPRRCWLAIDRDMSPVTMRGRTGRGKPVDFMLDGEARARLCAKLASAAWKAAGWATVKPMFPEPGGDWNDVLRARVEA